MKDKKIDVQRIKSFFRKIIIFLRNFLSVKKNRIITIVVGVLILILLLVIKFTNKNKNFSLDDTYNVYPEEVRDLYSNMINVSCGGDLHLHLKIDAEKVELKNADKDDLLNYMFSYLDKKGLLDNKISTTVIRNTEKELFYDKLGLINDIESFQYGDYVYTLKGGSVKRKKKQCQSDVAYVTHLYGFFWDDNKLSMDVNVGYLKDGLLYSLDNKKMGEYDGDVSKLSSIMGDVSYYRFNYLKVGNQYKLATIEWKSRN